jgi:hypothetical protein
MEQPAPPSTGKVIASVLLVGLGLAGLAMSLCGGFFAGFAVIELATGNSRGEARTFSELFIVTGSLSLVIGLVVIFLTVVAWKRVRRPAP